MLNDEKNVFEGDEVYYGVGSFLWEIVKVFFWALIIIIPIRVFLLQPFFVQGASMEPNFEDGDYLIVNELGYKKTNVDFDNFHFFSVNSFKNLERNDIAVFRYPRNPQQFFIKRVVALPGEEIRIESGKVTIFNDENPNGLVLDEQAYLPQGVITSPDVIMKLKDNEYFVMGDNRQFSHDSRAWGPVHKDEIIGKVMLRAWPINKAEIF